MNQNQNSVVVLRIPTKFRWMIPMGVKYNHTKLEQETQRRRPRTGFEMADLSFKNCSLGPKTAIFGLKNALEHIQKGQTKGNGGYTARAA